MIITPLSMASETVVYYNIM